MMAYNKAWTAIVSVLVMHLLRQWLGLDFRALGLNEALSVVVSGTVDAAWAGFWVWLVPNVRRALGGARH